jgi:hypothetical protein
LVVLTERRDDLAAVGVSDDDRRAVLKVEHLAQPRDVIGERAERELGRPHLEAVVLEALDHPAPTRPVGPGAMDENDVRATAHVMPTPFCRLLKERVSSRQEERASHDPAI